MTWWRGRRTTNAVDWHPAPSQLSDYLDDDLGTRERRRVDAHVSRCEPCSTLLEELRLVADQSFRLDEPSEPARDLWPEIQTRLVRRKDPAPGAWGTWGWRPVGLRPMVGVALAGSVVLALAITFGWLTISDHDTSVALVPTVNRAVTVPTGASDQQYAETLAGLRRAVHSKLTDDPRLLDVIEENLATIDVAIANYRDALTKSPDDVDLRGRISAARQRKLDVLREAATLATGASD